MAVRATNNGLTWLDSSTADVLREEAEQKALDCEKRCPSIKSGMPFLRVARVEVKEIDE